jgi:hypothetical protein
MLHPKQDRIDYGNQLVPPDGYSLDRAIGTTYSLDLEALMVLPVALFYAQPLDGDPSQLRYDMLDSITKAAERITVYCQKAQIKVPKKYHYLTAYWEKGIEEVQMDHYAQSFHPKVWIIRYTHAELPPVYRVLVTSRNLTFARDWDIAFSADGVVQEEEVKQNRPLIDFLKSVEKKGKTIIPENFYKDLQKVKFEKDLGKFQKLRFHPIGIGGNDGKTYINPVSKAKWWDELLIVSPFADDTTLRSLSQISGRKKYLLSRKEELDSVSLDQLANYTCYQFSKRIELSEFHEGLGETEEGEMIQNLHAKLFVTQADEKVHWFLGSANCTGPAQDRNIELLVELRGQPSGNRVKDILNELTNPDKADGIALFEPYDVANRIDVTAKKRIDLEIRKLKYDLMKLQISGEALPIENGTAYDLRILIDATNLTLPSDFSIKLKPVCEEQKKAVPLEAGKLNDINQFTGFAETRLSPFLEFEIWHQQNRYCSFLLTMSIEFPCNRLNKIFSSIIDSRDKFLKYLSFLLTGEETSVIDESPIKRNGTGKESEYSLFDQLPIYEKLLIASSRYPEKLMAVDKLIKRLKEETQAKQESIISQEFEEFWLVFRDYHKTLES